jgi:hypothetical protein
MQPFSGYRTYKAYEIVTSSKKEALKISWQRLLTFLKVCRTHKKEFTVLHISNRNGFEI